MNTEYVAWFAVLLLVGAAGLAFFAFGKVPEIDDDPGPPEAGDAQPVGGPDGPPAPLQDGPR